MYRIAKKTTKRTDNYCLKCKYCHEICKIQGDKNEGAIVECTAENRCFITPFNSHDFYCVEYKGLNELSVYEIEQIINENRKEYSKRAFREYANKYYSKKQAQKMIKAYNEKNK